MSDQWPVLLVLCSGLADGCSKPLSLLSSPASTCANPSLCFLISPLFPFFVSLVLFQSRFLTAEQLVCGGLSVGSHPLAALSPLSTCLPSVFLSPSVANKAFFKRPHHSSCCSGWTPSPSLLETGQLNLLKTFRDAEIHLLWKGS